MHEPGEHGQIVGGVRDRVAVEAQQVGRGVDRMGDQPAHDRLERVQPVRERRRDAEVPAAAAQRPEEIGVRRRVDLEHVALRRDELDREQVVGGEPVLGHQPAEAAAERVARDTRPGDRASGHRQPVLGGGVVQLRPDHAALGRGGCAGRDRSRSPSSRRGRSSPRRPSRRGRRRCGRRRGSRPRVPPGARARAPRRRRSSSGSGRSEPACGRRGRCARREPRRSPASCGPRTDPETCPARSATSAESKVVLIRCSSR